MKYSCMVDFVSGGLVLKRKQDGSEFQDINVFTFTPSGNKCLLPFPPNGLTWVLFWSKNITSRNPNI